jgi:hypothetical protein
MQSNYKLLTILLLTATAFAKSHAPLPDSVVAAKTVYIVNQTGYQSAADSAYEQFTKWARFKVLATKEGADISAVFVIDPADSRYVVMQVFSPSSPDPAYQTTERWVKFVNGPKSCVSDFRKRLESK